MSKQPAAKPAAKPAAQPAAQPAFEQSLTRLEEIVARLESGELTLEKALAAFEEGVKLSRECNAALEAVEQRIEVLTADGLSAEAFAEGAGADGDED